MHVAPEQTGNGAASGMTCEDEFDLWNWIGESTVRSWKRNRKYFRNGTSDGREHLFRSYKESTVSNVFRVPRILCTSSRRVRLTVNRNKPGTQSHPALLPSH